MAQYLKGALVVLCIDLAAGETLPQGLLSRVLAPMIEAQPVLPVGKTLMSAKTTTTSTTNSRINPPPIMVGSSFLLTLVTTLATEAHAGVKCQEKFC